MSTPGDLKISCSRIYNAVIFNHLNELQKYFSELGAEDFRRAINSQSGEHIATPLIMAVRNGYKDIAEYLLKKGADPQITGIVLFDGETICK